ncbi:phosphomannomutase [Agarivorans sp. Alg241-V36]|uniref:phosphomannomutase n=1 Tax=Agarivorans sp. Alg241-V36 TaxID=2305992 RepID=UPI0013D141F8|nr:phosphomannomutase [Agarivorans sp. Alg241-V36]
MKFTTRAFKSYDIRGRLPDELNEQLAYRIGRAFAVHLKAKTVALGYDIRLSSPALSKAIIKGLRDEGATVIDLGLVGTEEVYFATDHLQLDGGIMVTASHNPKDYNGMKLVRERAKPISGDSGLRDIEALVADPNFASCHATNSVGGYEQLDIGPSYSAHILSFVDQRKLKPLKIVVNAGNGAAGHMLDQLEAHLPFEFIKLNHQPDGNFPNGIPNPLLKQNRAQTAEAVITHGADFGVAWDGDVDRCFLFDEQGQFIEGYYLVGLLAQAFLIKHPGQKVIHDPRLTWNTIDLVEALGGQAIESKTGHAFIKEKMREQDAIYGGEMSAHHYFRDFAYCDSGMLPWLLVAELVSCSTALSTLVSERQTCYPVSGEINLNVNDGQQRVEQVLAHYAEQATAVSRLDGVSVAFEQWRFNLRCSNTEPLLRLNIETKQDPKLLEQKTNELLALLA